MLSYDVLQQYMLRVTELTTEELQNLARSQSPDTWAHSYWEWASREENSLAFAQFVVRMIRSLGEEDSYELAESLALILALNLNYVDPSIENINLSVLSEFFDKKLQAMLQFTTNIRGLYEGHPDVETSEGSLYSLWNNAYTQLGSIAIDIPDARLIDDFLARDE